MGTIDMKKDALRLLDYSEATNWVNAYPIGNGRLGAMVFGGAKRERLALNEDTLWSGYPRTHEYCGEGAAAYARMRALTEQGKSHEAGEEHTAHFAGYASEKYTSLGDLWLTFDTDDQTRISGYRRSLELDRAVCRTAFKAGTRVMRHLCFASAPDGVLVWRGECRNGQFSMAMHFDSRLYSRSWVQDSRLFLETECPQNSEQNQAQRPDREKAYSDDPQKRGIRALTAVAVVTDGRVTPRCTTDVLHVQGATYVEVYISCVSSFNGYDRHPFIEGKDYRRLCVQALERAVKRGYQRILRAHLKDYRSLFDRVQFDLGSDGRERRSTRQRLIDFEAGVPDAALPALLFHYGRYLTIAASRPGTQAMNLQGIWNGEFAPPWQSNYTVNINTEMNYFPTLAANLQEMYQPLLALIAELAQAGKVTANMLYGAGGWVCHHNTDIWRHSQPVCGRAMWSMWQAGGGWLCRHLFEYYEYTLDETFLRETALPIMEGAARFFLDIMVTDEQGYRMVSPSTSPENQFRDARGWGGCLSRTTEMTMAIVRELFFNCLRAAKILSVQDEVLTRIAEEYPKLYPLQLGRDGRVLEWYGEWEECEPHHRHVSHLYALHPAGMLDVRHDGQLAEACRRTLEARGDEGTGWSLAWKINFWASLFDGDRAYQLLKTQLRLCSNSGTFDGRGGTYANLFCAHPPFQIDGNFGALNGMIIMLLQSTTDGLHLLPALPHDFQKGSVTGLRAKGNREVDLSFEGGKLTYCRIVGNLPATVEAAFVDITVDFVQKDGAWVYDRRCGHGRKQ